MNTTDLSNPSLYINRELSYIEFNRRVLGECADSEHPLLERVKFLAIFNGNIDEFFMVRVSGLKQQVLLGITDRPADGLTPREQLVAIHRTVTQLFAEANQLWRKELHPELKKNGIEVIQYKDLGKRPQTKLREYFEREIFPVLTPLVFDPGHPFPHISNLSLNLAVVLKDEENDETHFARVKVPSPLPRLVPLKPLDPDELLPPAVQKFVWLEEVVAANLDRLFPGVQVVASYPFRVTRNTDMEIQEEEADDLLLTMEENLRQRHFGSVVRLEIDDNTPQHIRDLLIANLQIGQNDVYTTNGPLGLSSLWELHKLERPEFKYDVFLPSKPQALRTGENLFSTLQRQNILLHHPYDSFLPVVDFLEMAAEDPDVLAIKQTLYRVGSDPPIVRA
ncbi:MAG: polyphosphate kinase, partial [Anaerolineales bacterium]|nr:polyphosphate kinase [Anaerolineales bacterium]